MMVRSKQLQLETGYIDARPLTTRSTKTSCNARPDHTFGSISTDSGCLGHVRFTPGSDRIVDIPVRQVCPNFGQGLPNFIPISKRVQVFCCPSVTVSDYSQFIV